jgi:ribosome-binding protein aMBF1 (putative translation factor)
MEELRTEVAKCISDARRKAGFTQARLALKLGVGVKYVKDVENARQGISLDQLQKIAEALGAKSVSIKINLNQQTKTEDGKGADTSLFG